MDMQVQIALAARHLLGEAPHWSAEDSALYLVDIIARQVIRWQPGTDGEPRRWVLAEPVSAAIPRRLGGLVVTLASGVATMDAEGALTRIVAPDRDPGNRANEARCDAAGRLWLGTMHNNIGPDGEDVAITRSSGRLFRIDPDGTATCHATQVGISNTLAWTPDGRTLLFADSLANRIDAYPFDPETGRLGARRAFAAGGPGVPDGSAMDAEGFLWNARWGGGCLVRYAPDGSIDRTVALPARQPTSCAFGGPDLRTLYVTTARAGLDGPSDADGAVLMLLPGVAGLPAHSFAG